MEQCKISNMYTLEETIAKDYLAQFTYPWEALAGIGDYIKELGKTLNPDVYEQKGRISGWQNPLPWHRQHV